MSNEHVAEPFRTGFEAHFHEFTDTPCGRALARAEKGLGRPLAWGEMSDMLLDNFMEIADSNEAHAIRDSTVVVFGRTASGIYEGKILTGESVL